MNNIIIEMYLVNSDIVYMATHICEQCCNAHHDAFALSSVPRI